MIKSLTNLTLLTTFFLLVFSCSKPEPVTLGSLLNELTSREAKAEYPRPYFTCKQFSSYDRATTTPNDKSWFSNWDRSMFVRIDTIDGIKHYVMMDADGPGAIVRFWMTFGGQHPGEGTLQVFIDNNPVSVIEGNPFDILSRGKLVGAPLSSSVPDSARFRMRGHNLYLPIPYAKHCKVVYISSNIKDQGAKTGGEAVYYNIDYRTYSPETNVMSFSLADLEKYKDALQIAQQKLADRTFDTPENSGVASFSEKIDKGKSKEIVIPQKNEAVSLISVKLKSANPEQALRSTVLEMTFDGKTTVRCPVGDFFGTGYQIRPFNTYYTKVTADSLLSCSWVMPFKNTCQVKLENLGDQDVAAEVKIGTKPYRWNNRTMYFSAAWNQYTHLETGEMKSQEGDGMPFDMHYLNLKGKGVYMGDGICIFNTVYAWWGEGDEKIYLDDENFPSSIGTGTEDYYGYAWCRPEKFGNHPFIAQPDGSGNFVPGYSVNIRLRGLDDMPFSKAFCFDMEMWHWTRAVINFSHVNYWYVLPEYAIEPTLNVKAVQEPVALKREDIVSPLVAGHKIEAENLILKAKTGGDFYYDNNVRAGWSGNVQMVWEVAKPASVLHLAFFSDEEKTADAVVHYSAGKDYGRYQISFNHTGNTQINSYRPDAQNEQVVVKNIRILKGENTITLVADPLQKKAGTTAGIDFIEFK